jgi:hypothetical protein
MMGVLKGTSYTSIAAAVGLCTALVPLGVKLLNQGSALTLKSKIAWTGVIAGLTALLYLFGEAG